MPSMQLDDETLQKIYAWVDEIPLSRPKRNIARDFSDGVLMAEIVNHYFPKLVEMHNYSPANSVRQKMYNWSTLNQKVFKKLHFSVSRSDMEAAVTAKPGAIEVLLLKVQNKMAEYTAQKTRRKLENQSMRASGAFSHGSGSTGGTPQSRHDFREKSLAENDYEIPYTSSTAHGTHSNESNGEQSIPQGPQLDRDTTTLPNDSNAIALLSEKDDRIAELSETVEFLELKIKKLEQLLRLKDSRIQTLTARVQGQQSAES